MSDKSSEISSTQQEIFLPLFIIAHCISNFTGTVGINPD